MTDPSRHAADRNWIETILRHIPGFRGYLEKEYRRDSDHLLRQHLAEQVQVAKQQLDQVLRRLVDAVQLDALPPFERVRARLDGLASKLKSAERGYSGMFDLVRIREAELDEVYQVDLSLVESIGKLQPAIKDGGSGASPADHADRLIQQIDEIETVLARRTAILRGTDA